MSLTLYYHPDSQPSRTLMTFFHLTNLLYEPKFVNLLKGEQYSPEFSKINPRHFVPVLTDGDFILNESEAIIFYIMDSRDVGKEYYPEDVKIRAIINQYLPYHHSNVRPKLSELFNLTWFPQRIKGPKDIIRPQALELCQKFEEVFLKDDVKYIAGDAFTIADMFAVNEFTQVLYGTDVDFNKFPVLKKYIDRCLENKVLYEVNNEIRNFPERLKKYREEMAAEKKA